MLHCFSGDRDGARHSQCTNHLPTFLQKSLVQEPPLLHNILSVVFDCWPQSLTKVLHQSSQVYSLETDQPGP